jgi:hypothetical protein
VAGTAAMPCPHETLYKTAGSIPVDLHQAHLLYELSAANRNPHKKEDLWCFLSVEK